MKDAIESLTKKYRLSEYTKDGNRDMEESSKHKSSSKSVDAMANSEGINNVDKKTIKGKRHHITTIIGGVPRVSYPLKGMIKRKIDELITVHK